MNIFRWFRRIWRKVTSKGPVVKIRDYKGSTALIVQNDQRPELYTVFYIKKWNAPCDKVIERLEGNEYTFVGDSND